MQWIFSPCRFQWRRRKLDVLKTKLWVFTKFRGVSLKSELVPTCLKDINSVLFHYCRGQCPQLLASGNREGIRLGQMYSKEALHDLHSMNLSLSVGYRLVLDFFNVKSFSFLRSAGWNDKIVALEKTTWFHFRLMKTGFLFFFVADHLLVGQLCTNPKSDRSLLSCLKETQCSTSKIGDAPLYNSCTLPIQIMTTGPLPAPCKCNSGLPRVTGTCPGWWKQSFRLRLLSLVWFQVRATSCHLISSKSAWKSTPKCTWMCWRVWWSRAAIRWPVADLGVVAGIGVGPTSPKRPRLVFRRRTTTLYPSLTGPSSLPTWTCWNTSFGHRSRTWPPTTPKPAWWPLSTEYSPSSRRRLRKRHAPSSGSVSRRWLRLKAATLNRSHILYIVKLPELIFSIKVLK